MGLAEVTVSTHFGDALLTVISLGFAAPATVEWTCAKMPSVEAQSVPTR